jgi:mannosyl-3-phosphoglycerate phosphatase
LVHAVLFTDIDGTLIDTFTGHFSTTKKFVRKLTRLGVPVIFCSSKTMAEQVKLRNEVDLEDPFVVENGGAVFSPLGYFEDLSKFESNYNVKTLDNFKVIELGLPSAEIKFALRSIRDNYNLKFKGISDLSVDRISTLTAMPSEAVSRMIQREYGETILELNKNDLQYFVTIVEDRGLKVIFGGRFFDITGGNDKGMAVKILIDLYKSKFKNDVVFFGIGDSKNDESMLNNVDYPMLVQHPDKTWTQVKVHGLNRLEGVGPEGWILGFNEILNFFKK